MLRSGKFNPPPVLFGTLFLILSQSNPITGGNFESHFQIDAPTQATKFGAAIDGVGDVDGDGIPDFIVGSRLEDNAFIDAGSAYVYSGADASMLFHFQGNADFQFFGARVAAAGDLNKDQIPDFLIASPKANGTWQTEGGRVWAYSGADGQLLHEFIGAYPYERLGYAICAAGDANHDGYDDFAISSAPYSNSGTGARGTVYLMSGFDGAILHTILDPGPINSWFGNTLTNAGDLDGDGHPDLAVGCPHYSPDASDLLGAVLVYSGAAGVRLRKIVGQRIQSDFGASIAVIDDMDGDGADDFIIGAPRAATSGIPSNGEGMAFVYSSAINGTLLLSLDGWVPGSRFGAQVCAPGDINLDGVPDLVVSAPNDYSSATTISYFSGADGTFWGGAWADDGRIAVFGDVQTDGHPEIIVGAPLDGDGSVQIHGLNPYLHAGTDHLSARRGGNLVMRLDFPNNYASMPYKVLFSASGNGPTNSWVDIPLSWDDYFRMSFHGNYPGTFQYNLQGDLDEEGGALTSIGFGNGLPKSLIGSTLWLAAVVTTPNGKHAICSSVAKPLLITP
jgi:hypothetical protein